MTTHKPTNPAPASVSPPRFHPFPQPVQLALAFVLGIAVALVAARLWHVGMPRPTERERIVVATPIELNSASKAELMQLPGVGDRTADKILATRAAKGGFNTADGLREVKGMGPTRLDKVSPWVRVDGDEQAITAKTPTAKTGEAPRGTTKKALSTEMIDVNRASATDLQKLPGIGSVLAQRIIVEREKSPFRTPEDLRRVPGIGPKTLEKLRPHVTCDDPAVANDMTTSRQ